MAVDMLTHVFRAILLVRQRNSSIILLFWRKQNFTLIMVHLENMLLTRNLRSFWRTVVKIVE